MELRHGWIALGHFDGWFKLTILRSRFRPDCLKTKWSDGLDTDLGAGSATLSRPWQQSTLHRKRGEEGLLPGLPLISGSIFGGYRNVNKIIKCGLAEDKAVRVDDVGGRNGAGNQLGESLSTQRQA
jgi:hypothetical protein